MAETLTPCLPLTRVGAEDLAIGKIATQGT
jgi:hypothetical protein